ncbi:MAG: hypothetical protein PWQ52_668 [Methanolobus sp.]|nr:hypothetical protein [Methanolobus sp.]
MDESKATNSMRTKGMDEGWPLETLAALIFDEKDGKTRLTIISSGISNISAVDRDNMEQGWRESLDKLAGHLNKAKC